MEKQKKNNIRRKIHQNNKLNLEKKIVGKRENTNRLILNALKKGKKNRRKREKRKKNSIRKPEGKATGMDLWMMIFVHY